MKGANFIDNWVFRVLSPIVTGTIAYLLILLLNNNIDQLFESFITDEYFVCIGLALIVLESTRAVLSQHERIAERMPFWGAVLSITLSIVILVIALVYIVMSSYYNSIVGYQPNLSEIQPFILLYIGLSAAYSSFYLSNFYLKKSFVKTLHEEDILARQSKEDFMRMTRGVNPDLLFESLESIITLLHKDKDQADDLIDHLSIVYRYTLSNNQKEIVPVDEELYVLDAFARLINQLPYRKIVIDNKIEHVHYLIPGTLLWIIEMIVKSTISRDDEPMIIYLISTVESLNIQYVPHDKLTSTFEIGKIEAITSSYKVYSDRKVQVKQLPFNREVIIPNLNIQN